jgi:general secretion pathway protein A
MYESYYKFRAKPFQLNPDPAFFYGSKGHKRAMAYLEYGLHQGEGFIVITGEVGAGKTTLVRNLFRKLQTENVVAAQLVSTQLDADDMLRMVTAAFGLAHEDASKAVLLKRLEGFLQTCHGEGKRALLVVDEAQNLSPRAVEELRMLSNFQSQEKSLLQSFLLGQPEFRFTLQSETMSQLRQRVIASYHLGPIDAQETKEYVLHRLRTVGWNNDPAFTDDAVAAIYEYSSGIPRKINTLCDRVLLMGYLEEMHRITRESTVEVIKELQGEMAAPGGGTAPQTALADHPISQTAGHRRIESEEAVAGLERRVLQLEKSIVGVLKLMREVLEVTSPKRLRPGAPPDKIEAIK